MRALLVLLATMVPFTAGAQPSGPLALTLEDAIRKMTSLPAQRLGWKDRGILRKGSVADLVLFDPATVIDRSTFADPTALSTGIEKVFVNGVLVWDSGKPTGARPGIVIGRKGAIPGVAN